MSLLSAIDCEYGWTIEWVRFSSYCSDRKVGFVVVYHADGSPCGLIPHPFCRYTVQCWKLKARCTNCPCTASHIPGLYVLGHHKPIFERVQGHRMLTFNRLHDFVDYYVDIESRSSPHSPRLKPKLIRLSAASIATTAGSSGFPIDCDGVSSLFSTAPCSAYDITNPVQLRRRSNHNLSLNLHGSLTVPSLSPASPSPSPSISSWSTVNFDMSGDDRDSEEDEESGSQDGYDMCDV